MNKTGTGFSVYFARITILLAGVMSAVSCKPSQNSVTLFQEILPDLTGIKFTNQLTFDENFNIYTYRNYYNGGGVGLADVNNDGLLDIYLTGNMVPNKLYLNKGNFVFEDITDVAGVAGTKAWSTGVSMADVNGDGFIDIYVCNSGDIKGDNKQNELFLNNGDLTFREAASEYGIADEGFTTHAVFFDYDRDGDLDLYILNNSYQAIGSFNMRKNERPNRDPLGGDKLMRNDGNRFTDVSAEAGIYGSVIGFGLGVTVGDINGDSWPDIYVSNDFFERDYLYVNNRNGTFSEVLTQQMKSISGASMGADLADINNDGHPDIFVTEMLPNDPWRIKTVTTFENWDRYQYAVENGYFHQFTRNMLQLNNANGTFSEIGRLSGVEATDWSWGALMFDMDNDGLKDIFVANGIYQDLTNQDYLQYISSEEVVKSIITGKSVNYKKLVELIPSNPVANVAFHNEGNLRFVDKASEWGLGTPGFSNGSAYGDLDNDGDLDLVVNNVNSLASVFRNNSELIFPQNRYLKFILKGEGLNTGAFGTKIQVREKDRMFYLEQMPIRGFESSMDPRPNIGLGAIDTVDEVSVTWPDGKQVILSKVPTNQTVTLSQSDGQSTVDVQHITNSRMFVEDSGLVIDYVHKENTFVDFDRDRLIFHMLSTEGPRISKGDINGDGLDDLFIGGAKDQPGVILIQQKYGVFHRTNIELLDKDKGAEDLGSLFFDADNDGDLDLYVCSGGNEFSNVSSSLVDRLYFNDGKGNFERSRQALPTPLFESTSTVKASDFDGDGDLDLFVGVRLSPGYYGMPVNGYILQNDGKGGFTNVTQNVAPELLKIGMITDAEWFDLDGDNKEDLIIVGDYMPVTIFRNKGGKLERDHTIKGLDKSHGWWNRIIKTDLDNDGDTDFVLGNHGTNSRFRASVDEPVTLYLNDFDQNGTVEHIICTYVAGKSIPIVLRHDLVQQIPSLKKRFLRYEDYKTTTITDLFPEKQVSESLRLDAYCLENSVLINEGENSFVLRALPREAQISPLYAIAVRDFDGDGLSDLILGGNLYRVKPEIGRYDASYGIFLKGNGKGGFTPVPNLQSGLNLDGEVRDIVLIQVDDEELMLVIRNNDSVLSYRAANAIQ
jgi:enediyne biosynthesis protein E4